MKEVLSLFDESGHWPAYFADAGHNVMSLDIKHHDSHDAFKYGVEHFFEELGIEWVDGIIMAPPCTDFANSGAWVWPAKDEDGRTEASVELVRQGLRSVEFLEAGLVGPGKPGGRLPRLVPKLGKPRLIFDPCDHAGWLEPSAEELAALDALRARDGAGFNADEVEFVKRLNAYTKKTCLWGEFELPEKRRIEPVKVCAQGSWLQKLGGKSAATKAARSATPLGFARAFYEANEWSERNAWKWELKRMAAWVRDLEMSGEHALAEAEAEFGFDNVTREELAAALS